MSKASKQVVKFKKLDPKAVIPTRATEYSAGLDLYALEYGYLQRGQCSGVIRTGIAMALPPGFEAQVRPRSGLAKKYGVTVTNSPGTIDSDYRGPIGVLLANLGELPFYWKPHDRIAQLVIQRVPKIEIEVVEELDETERGDGGYGSTGR